jgi:hypothetical protein
MLLLELKKFINIIQFYLFKTQFFAKFSVLFSNMLKINEFISITKAFNFKFLFAIIIFLSFLSIDSQAQRPNFTTGSRPGGNFGNFGSGGNTTTNSGQSKSGEQKIKKPRIKRDSTSTIIPDSLKSLDNTLETSVESFSSDSTILDVENQMYYLYGEAKVVYGDIELTADYIKLDWGKSEVYAHGMPDTTKKVGEPVKGKPIFTDAGEAYNSDTLRYNFKSKKAIVSNIVSQQGEGYLQGRKVKKDAEDNMYLSNARYTTCDLKDPHFHIKAKKIKLVNKKSLISGPFNLVLSDIPLPIGLPIGFFPIPKKKEIGTSGFIMGNYGEEPNNRGFYFRDFGYYHAFNEYIGAKLIGQFYTNLSFGIGVQSTYTVKYKYAGNLNLQFNSNKNNILGKKDKQKPQNDFNISWSHSPQSLRPDRSFSANINLVSNGFNKNNRRLDEVDQYTNNTFGSSVQYSRSFGKLLRTSSGFRVDQNVSTKALNASLDYTFGLNQFNPFVKEKNQIGKWYESFRVGLDVTGGWRVNNAISQITSNYTDYNIAGIDNKPQTNAQERELQRLQTLISNQNLSVEERALYEAQIKKLSNPVIEDFNEILKNSIFNTSYTVPISLPNFKLAKYINITPSISYRGDVFSKELSYGYYNPKDDKVVPYTKSNGKIVNISLNDKADSISYKLDGNKLNVILNPNSGGVVVVDTINGVAFGQSVSYGTSINTRFYGTYRFGRNSRVQAIRHTVAPSLSISYTPDSDGQYARKVVVRQDSIGTDIMRYLPRFVNGGGGSGGSQSGSISFGISNQLEAKVKSNSDTSATQFEKISLLDNFQLSGGYNLLARKKLGEFALSNIGVSANSSLFKGLINLNAGGTLDPYAYEEDKQVKSNQAGLRVTKFKWDKDVIGNGGQWLSNFNISVSTSIKPSTFNKSKKKPVQNNNNDPGKEAMQKFVQANPMAYVDFSVPWSLNLSYNFNYNKQGLAASQSTQAFQFNGDLSLSPKLKINVSSGWDFVYKAVTLTNLSIIRELHCWDMSINWTPIAGNNLRASNYSFTLQPRSSLLKDLKLSRRRQYYDRGGF